MYFRYLLVAVLLACTYGYEIPDDNASANTACTCRGGQPGIQFTGGCGLGYQFCGSTVDTDYPCCMKI